MKTISFINLKGGVGKTTTSVGLADALSRRGRKAAAALRGVRVAGKTGTAENSGEDHAWFIGSAERSGRKIVMAVIVEEGGFGGSAAARIARTGIQTYFEGLR